MKYAFDVYKTKVEDHEFWVVQSKELKGCVAQADTLSDALSLFSEIESEWLETAKEVGIPIPEHTIQELPVYSGKFTVRVSPRTHEEAAVKAKRLGISLNQYVNDAVVNYNACGNKEKDMECTQTVTIINEEVKRGYGRSFTSNWLNARPFCIFS